MTTAVLHNADRSIETGSQNEGWCDFPSRWDAITEPRTSVVIEPRKIDGLGDCVAALLRLAPFSQIAAGRVRDAMVLLQDLPPAILVDIERLASRFTDFTGSDRVRIRLEQIATNSCRKVHADYTDLRLITTYAGPGTQIALDNDPGPEILLDVPAGYIGLFKGCRYGGDHKPCYHRSPPAADLGVKRLVLVIDTQTFASDGACG